MRYSGLLLILLSTLIWYPIYFMFAIMIDLVSGSWQLYGWILLDSKHHLLKVFIGDWLSSLLIALVINVLLVAGMIFLIRRYTGFYIVVIQIGLILMIGFALSWFVVPVEIVINFLAVIATVQLINFSLIKIFSNGR